MKATVIAPSVLTADHGAIVEAALALQAAGADRIHLDVMDGQFVPPITFGAKLASDLKKRLSIPLEAHLMVLTPEKQFEAFIDAGCDRITFHAEATSHAYRLAQVLRERGVQAGVAINPGTPARAVEALIETVDLVLVMTVNPGWGGQPFLKGMLEKVRAVRAMSEQIDVQVDGGMNDKTLPLARSAGANVFVVGNYLFEAEDLEQAIKGLGG